MIGALEMGGSQALVMNLYRHIDREKIQFDFILDHPDRDDYVDEVKALGGRIYTMPGFHGNVHQVRRAWDEFFTNHPEYKVLHSHVRSYASLYLPIAKRHGVKTIIHSHSTSNGKGFSSLVKMALQYPLRYQADVLMGCSKESGEWLFGKKATAGDRFFFLPNGVDLQRFSFDENIRQQYRRDMGLEDKIVIGHVGRFHPAKNHMFLLESFAQLKRLRPNAVLLLVGDGELRGEIESKISQLGLIDSVMLTGNRSDVAELMQAMDTLAFPSAWEGLPTTVVEAQATGLPCIISDRITEDVDLSPLVQRLSIDNPELWAKVLAYPQPRQNVQADIIASGFEINSAAAKLCQLYESLYS
jgi:glycosyltransferase involved in cell wall biosynthesis